jgi:hypothetical protein
MQTPEREDLRHQLESIEALQKKAEARDLSEQLSEWVQLLMKKKQIDKLRKLRKPR